MEHVKCNHTERLITLTGFTVTATSIKTAVTKVYKFSNKRLTETQIS